MHGTLDVAHNQTDWHRTGAGNGEEEAGWLTRTADAGASTTPGVASAALYRIPRDASAEPAVAPCQSANGQPISRRVPGALLPWGAGCADAGGTSARRRRVGSVRLAHGADDRGDESGDAGHSDSVAGQLGAGEQYEPLGTNLDRVR